MVKSLIKLSTIAVFITFVVITLGGGCTETKYYESFSILQTSPSDQAVDIPRDAEVWITFSADMAEETLCSSTIFITGPTGNVSSVVTYDNVNFIAIVTPAALFDYSENYTVTVTTDIKASEGRDRRLNEDYVFSFITVHPADLTVVGAVPAGNALNVALDATPVVYFDQELDCSSVDSASFIMEEVGGSLLTGTLAVNNNAISFTPSAPLSYSTSYMITLSTDLKTAIATDDGGWLPSAYSYTFKTVHPRDLAIVASSPSANTTTVDVLTDVEIIFDQDVDNATVTSSSFYVEKYTGEGVNGTYLLPPSTATNKIVFQPDGALEYNTVYRVVLTTDIASTIATSGGGSLADNVSFTFETQATPPLEIVTVSPADAETGVSISTDITVTFNADVYETTLGTVGAGGPGFFINPGLTSDNSTAVSGTISYDSGTFTATFTLDCALSMDTDYTVTLVGGGSGIVGTGGQILPATYTSQFHTRVSSLIASTDPADGETAVDVDRPISINFLEAMNTSTITSASFYATYEDRFERTVNVSGAISFIGGNMTAVLTPDNAFEFDTVYTVTLGSGITTADGLQSLTGGHTFSFTTDTPPLISQTRADNDYVTVNPLSGATDVPVLANYSIVFARMMDPATIDNTTIILADYATSTQVNGTVVLSADCYTATIMTDERLEFETVYEVTLAGGFWGVADNEGNFLDEDYTFTFTTSEANVVEVVPNTITAKRNHRVIAVFTRPLAPLTVNDVTFYVINDTTSHKVSGLISVASDRRSISFGAIPEFDQNTDHSVYLTVGVLDNMGNPLNATVLETFKTTAAPDENSPTVLLISPSGTDVSGGAGISVTFTEHIIPPSFRTTNPVDNVNDTVLVSYVDGATTKYVTGTTSFYFDDANERTVATFTPDSYLEAGENYSVVVTIGVCDLSTIALAAESSWSFIVETTAPSVDSSSPADGDNGISVGGPVSVTFDEDMDPASFTSSSFHVTQGGSPVSGTISVSGNTATFTPATYFTGGLQYDVTVYDNVTDLAGNALSGGDYSFSFTAENTAITVTGVVPLDNSTGVDVSTTVAITLSEAPNPGTITYSTVSTPGTVRVSGPSGEVYGDLAISGNVVTFTPAEELDAGATYTVTVTTSVTDLGGTALDQDSGTAGNQEFTSTFTTSP